MARPRSHLEHAPIVEAVIDFRVLRQTEVSSETFANLRDHVGKEYTQRIPISSFQAQFGIDNGQLSSQVATQDSVGWLYRKETELAQFRVDGFTFSKIEPYTTWELVFEEAIRLWKLYVDVAKPFQVTRIAVRYINRIKILGAVDLGRYLAAPPVLPLPIPQGIREFLSRVYVDDDRGASAVIVQALEPRIDPNWMSFLLDIDAFREMNVSPSDLTIQEAFGALRKLKNDIFFASITEETLEMYK